MGKGFDGNADLYGVGTWFRSLQPTVHLLIASRDSNWLLLGSLVIMDKQLMGTHGDLLPPSHYHYLPYGGSSWSERIVNEPGRNICNRAVHDDANSLLCKLSRPCFLYHFT